MSQPAITIENLSKRYLVGHQAARRETSPTLRDAIVREARTFARKAIDVIRGRQIVQGDEIEEFWALRNVSFEVKQGEIVGIIGRNGAGKSTLLKVLSRITDPTEGRVKLRGRVASLLEVGTGFHAELTGRENIFLNGAILGMTRQEIRRKFDEIVAFAEVDRFLDTPVKRYSSGMYVRLAFAVAAHLEPQILIVDEVLAVGDAEFQKKCLGKMSDVSRDGRTVLFVSHNLDAIRTLCRTAVLLQEGQLAFAGPVDQGIDRYLSSGVNLEGEVSFHSSEDKPASFRKVRVLNHTGLTSGTVDVRHGFSLEFTYESRKPLKNLEVAFRIYTSDARPVFTSLISESLPEILQQAQFGKRKAIARIPGNFLYPGNYYISVALHESGGVVFDHQDAVLQISVEDTGTIFTKYHQDNHVIGVVINPLEWTCTFVADGI
jgi:lipopolysaccharide transport system ATP-binding protein